MRPPWWARPTAAVLFGGGGMWPARMHGSAAVERTHVPLPDDPGARTDHEDTARGAQL